MFTRCDSYTQIHRSLQCDSSKTLIKTLVAFNLSRSSIIHLLPTFFSGGICFYCFVTPVPNSTTSACDLWSCFRMCNKNALVWDKHVEREPNRLTNTLWFCWKGKKQISSWAIARKLLFRTNIMDWAYNPEMFCRLKKTLSLAMISPKSKVNGHGNLFFISVDRYHGDSDDSIFWIYLLQCNHKLYPTRVQVHSLVSDH